MDKNVDVTDSTNQFVRPDWLVAIEGSWDLTPWRLDVLFSADTMIKCPFDILHRKLFERTTPLGWRVNLASVI